MAVCDGTTRRLNGLMSEKDEKAIILCKNAGEIMHINVLQKGFNIHNPPLNYMNYRTTFEEIIYHAVRADTVKSPYTSFKMANQYLGALDNFDVLTGMRSLKGLIKMIFDSSVRTSTIIHRVGDLFLFDEFDIDSFILTCSSYDHWPWLEEFMNQHKILMNAAEFSRHALTMRDLYIKFLYHTVGASNSFVSELTHHGSGDESESSQMPLRAIISARPSHLTSMGQSSKPSSAQMPGPHSIQNADDFLRLAQWQVDDLSFLVGSDLAIFGNKAHPCVSLRLSPINQPINVLTGIDMWLENILNEIPEVAMCFHNEGIVMQEYELYKTIDLPQLMGFDRVKILRIMRNLAMFLKNNLTREGHTYWLIKEAGIDVVKLYDLTVLCEKSESYCAANSFDGKGSDRDSPGVNPFLLPVATLCFKLAEHRVTQREKCMRSQATVPTINTSAKPRKTSKQQNTKMGFEGVAAEGMDDYVMDQRVFLTDVLRLLRSCLNLISTVEDREEEGEAEERYERSHLPSFSRSSSPNRPPPLKPYADLKARALLLLCQIYLSTPPEDVVACASQVLKPTPITPEVVSVNVAEFATEKGATDDVIETVYPSTPSRTASPATQASPKAEVGLPSSSHSYALSKNMAENEPRRLGDKILETFRCPQTDQVSILAMQLAETLRPTLPCAGLAISSPEVNGVGGSDPGWACFLANHHRPGSVENSPRKALVATTTASAESAVDNERWNRRFVQASEMLPLMALRQAVLQACRLWSRVFVNSAAPINRETLSRTNAKGLLECAHITVSALLLLEHQAPPKKTCRFCSLKPSSHQSQCLSSSSSTLLSSLTASTRRFFVHMVLGLHELRQASGFRFSVDEAALKRISKNSFVSLYLSGVCPSASRLLPSLVKVALLGPATPEHVCKERGAVTCSWAESITCAQNSWLRILDLSVQCLEDLLPRVFEGVPEETDGTSKATSRLIPYASLPNFMVITLYEFHLTLRAYADLISKTDPDSPLRLAFESWMERLHVVLKLPLLEQCLDRIPVSLQFLFHSMRFQAIKVAIVYAPHLLCAPKSLAEAGGHPLPQMLQHLRMALEALRPGLSLTFVPETDISPLVHLILDMLRTADEYCRYGLREMAVSQKPWLAENIKVVLRFVEKCLPFQLNVLLSNDVLLSNSITAAGKRRGNDLCLRLLSSGLLNAQSVRSIITFLLNVTQISLFCNQLVGGNCSRHSDAFVSSATAQLKVAMAWLKSHLSVMGGIGDADHPNAYRNYNLVLLLVSNILLLQGEQRDVLSESGLLAILRDALPLYGVVPSLESFLDKEDKSEDSSLEQELHSLLVQLVTSLRSMGSILQAKVEQAGSAKSVGRRNKRKVKGCGSVHKRNLEALKTVCEPSNFEPPLSRDDQSYRLQSKALTKTLLQQLDGIKAYLNEP